MIDYMPLLADAIKRHESVEDIIDRFQREGRGDNYAMQCGYFQAKYGILLATVQLYIRLHDEAAARELVEDDSKA